MEAILQSITFYVKTAVATFWAPHEKIWLLFIPTSGHTANINNIELLFKVPFATSKTLLRHYKTTLGDSWYSSKLRS